MKQVSLKILENAPLSQGVYRLRLGGDVSAVTAPGQFVNIKLDGFFLRRPISVCDWQAGELTLIYKVLGHGTEHMTHLPVSAVLDVLTGLGNGYDLTPAGAHPLLVGGGVRDVLLGRSPKDFDIATDATPEQVRRLFRNCRLIGRRFRLAHVLFGRDVVEVATFRASGEDVPGRQADESGRLLRDNVVVFEGNLDSLRRFKDDVKEVATSFECGVGLEKFNDIKEGDVVECFINEQVER